MVYIDTSTFDDYDKVVRFLHKNNIPIVRRDKVRMVVSAELTTAQLNQMHNECEFEDLVTAGPEPLDGHV